MPLTTLAAAVLSSPTVLGASVTDWVERVAPLVLLAFGVIVLLLRGRERRRGPDEDDG